MKMAGPFDSSFIAIANSTINGAQAGPVMTMALLSSNRFKLRYIQCGLSALVSGSGR